MSHQDELSDIPHLIRCPFLEANAYLHERAGLTSSYPEIRNILHDSIQHVANMEGRRIIKTHLPFEFLPQHLVDTCKVLYVCRKPADAMVSNYHYIARSFKGTFETFMKIYMRGMLLPLYLLCVLRIKDQFCLQESTRMETTWITSCLHGNRKIIQM